MPKSNSANAVYLVTFAPLAKTQAGRQAIARFGLPPFIDGSIRREPDFQHPLPAMTCLCRADKFVPRLRTGDLVVHMTQRSAFGLGRIQQRLVSVLRVIAECGSHDEAAAYYRDHGMKLPGNLLVDGNGPEPFNRSHQEHSAKPGCVAVATEWDRSYQARATRYPQVRICRPVFCCVNWEAPEVTEQHLRRAFGRIPGTQNPGKNSIDELQQMFGALGIRATLNGL